MACDAKMLEEDEETGVKRKYVKTGENQFSLAFTYACMATNSVRFRS